jgi:iron complex transport system substrate-binding protein
MVNGMLSRRRLLQGLLAMPFIGIASAAVPRRVAILDWGLAELALALGVTPTAVSAPNWYRKLINVPAMPTDVVDIGLLFQPNLEALYALRPDNIIITPQHALLTPILERIAPVVTLPVNGLAGYTAATKQMAALFDRKPQADALIQHLQQQMAQTRESAAGLSARFFWPLRSIHCTSACSAKAACRGMCWRDAAFRTPGAPPLLPAANHWSN